MKKLISLSVAAMFSLASMAQDTSLNRGTVPPPGAMTPPATMDTIPGNNRSQRDSSNMQWKNNPDRRGVDSSLDQRSDTSKWNHRDTSAMATPTPGDTSSMSNTSNDDLRTNRSNQDSMATTHSADQNTQADSSQASEAITDRIVMRNDSLLLIQNGEAATLDKEYTLQSGAKVSTEGMVKFPSGKNVQLKNGQFIELTSADNDDSGTTDKKKEKHKKGKKKSKTKE